MGVLLEVTLNCSREILVIIAGIKVSLPGIMEVLLETVLDWNRGVLLMIDGI